MLSSAKEGRSKRECIWIRKTVCGIIYGVNIKHCTTFYSLQFKKEQVRVTIFHKYLYLISNVVIYLFHNYILRGPDNKSDVPYVNFVPKRRGNIFNLEKRKCLKTTCKYQLSRLVFQITRVVLPSTQNSREYVMRKSIQQGRKIAKSQFYSCILVY